jgi:hypothetical protein
MRPPRNVCVRSCQVRESSQDEFTGVTTLPRGARESVAVEGGGRGGFHERKAANCGSRADRNRMIRRRSRGTTLPVSHLGVQGKDSSAPG